MADLGVAPTYTDATGRIFTAVGTFGAGGGSGGLVQVTGLDGLTVATDINPFPVLQAQGVLINGPLALTANTTAQIIGAFAGRRGMAVLNFTTSPVYLIPGTTGDPVAGAGSWFIPPARTIEGALYPGEWEPAFAPVGGVRARGATAGGLTVTVW